MESVQGRSFHTNASAKYLLPNDSPEHARLERQHEALVTVLKGRLVHAPVPKSSQILDAGCGTGCMTDWFAHSFADAFVTGLDLSPVPKLREQPANVRYLQGDIVQQSPRDWISEDGDRPVLEEKGMFDLVYSRFLLAGINDWEGYIKKQFVLLKPGGWAEFHEPVIAVNDAEGQTIEERGTFGAGAGAQGMDVMCGQKMKGWMESLGFEKVQVEIYHIPIGGQGQTTQELRDIGEFMMANTLEVTEIAARRSMLGRDEKEVEELVKQNKARFAEADGWYIRYYATYGKKPE